jgi:hypothetical protein
MIPDTPGKSESVKNDPGDLARALELELLHKRAAWQRERERYGAVRTISIFFVVVVVAASVAGFFWLFSRFSGERAHQPASAAKSSDG